MMPGESPPAATPAGIAGEAAVATACAKCGALQQNLNEYVAALIALKQKIIDTDHLLTEYQQKCNELDAAKRENNTLHHQVEQMFQKISPLKKCEEELGSVKAELEEKKSSLKIYQETHLEYVRVKEEMDKSDIVKKKLETKVKKLEEAAAKHIQEFKQLKAEKKVLEKELKKAQEKIDGFPGPKHKKVLKNAETQSEKENPVANLNKEKIKLLLEELWMCISGSTGEDQIKENDYILGDSHSHSRTRGRTKMMQNPEKIKKSQGQRDSDGSLSETCTAETTLSSLHIKLDKRSIKHSGTIERKTMEATEIDNSIFCEGRSLEDISQTDVTATGMTPLSKDQDDESLRDVLKWARPLPPLLSPIQFSPATTPDILFGDITDSSDEEMDDSAQMLENIIEKCGQDEQTAESKHEKHSAEPLNKCSSSSANSDPQDPTGSSRILRREELALCSDPATAESKCLNERNAKSKDEEKNLRENSVFVEIHTASEMTMPITENVKEETVNTIETKIILLTSDVMPVNVQDQGKTIKLMDVQRTAVNGTGPAFEGSSDFMKNEEKALLTGTIEDYWSQSPKRGDQQHTGDPIFVVASVPGIPEKCKDGSSIVSKGEGMAEESFGDIQAVSNSGEVRSFGEEATESVTVDEQNTATGGLGTGRSGDPSVEQKVNISNCKFLSETEHPIEQVEQEAAEVSFTQSIEKKMDVSVGSQCIEENCISEERYDKQNIRDQEKTAKLMHVQKTATEENREDDVMNVGISSSQLNTAEVADGCKKSLYQVNEEVQTETECRTSFPMSIKKIDDNQVEIADSMAEEFKSVDIKRAECLQLQQLIDQKDNCKSPEEQPDRKSNCTLPAQASVIKDSLLQCEDPVKMNSLGFETESVTGSLSKLDQIDNADTESQCKSKIPSISNNFHTIEASVKGERLASEELEKEDGELLNTTETVTVQSVMAGGSVFETVCNRSVETNLISENLQYGMNGTSQEMSDWNSKNSCHRRKCAVEKDKKNGECAVTKEMLSEQNRNEDPAQSVQDAPRANNSGAETVLPVTVMAASQSATEPMDVSASSLEVFSRDSPSSDVAANTLSSVPVCITSSSPVREDITHFDHNTAESWKNKEETAADSGGKTHEPLDCCRPSNNTDEESVSKSQAQFTLTDSSSRESYKALTPGTSNLSSVKTVDIIRANKSVLGDQEPLILPDKKLGGNSALEHTVAEAAAEETGDILSIGKISAGVGTVTVPENTVMVMNSSVSVSSEEEEDCLLRKVKFTRTPLGLLVAKSEIGTVRNSHTGAASTMTLSGGDGHEVASQKDNQDPGHDPDSCASEAVERTWDHSYSVELLCNNEHASLKLKASIGKEKSEGRLAEENISTVASLLSQEVKCNGESAPRESSVSDLEIASDVITPNTKCSGASIETSKTQSHFSKGNLNAEQGRNVTASAYNANLEQNHSTSHHVDGGNNTSRNKECHIGNNGKTSLVKASWNFIPPDLEPSNCSSKPQKLVLEKLESFVDFASYTKNGAEQIHEPSDSVNAPGVKGGHNRLFQKIAGHKRKRKSRHTQLAEATLTSADTTTLTTHYPKTLTKIRQEMGPPLPPLLPPLMGTPPRTVRPRSPGTSQPCQPSLPSSLNDLISPLHKIPVPPVQISPLSDTLKCKSPTFTTPSPCEMPVGQRILSSPLQFCATTPKHALPVPGRLPPSATGAVAPPVSQENSVKILDSMYPELSARARTLNILKGNIQLSRSSSVDGKNIPQPVHQISGFKAIASTSTAFVKAGTQFKCDPEQTCNTEEAGKRTLSPVVPKSAKRPRLEGKSSDLDLGKEPLSDRVSDADTWCPPDETDHPRRGDVLCESELRLAVEKVDDPESRAVTVALEKISEACFDLLPVIRSHVHVGNTSRVPVMRDEEKEVVYELGVAKKSLAEPALQAILNKLKKGKMSLSHNCIQSLCRVYVGICRQLGDLERARLFCYSLLKEDFPKSDRLTLFIGNVWTEILSSEGVVSKAIQLIARQRARGNVLKCLKTYLNWEESTPVEIGMMVSSLLLAIQLCPQMEFQFSDEYGEDLKESIWEYVFAIDLLCSHQKWCWTHDNIISKELWPIMDKWIKNRKGNGSVSSPSDIIVATVLRLIGRLGQIGLKEGFSPAVENISSVIGVFLQHAKEKDVAWGVQLAAAYALCDLGPSNPSKILEAIRAWEAMNTHSLPPAIGNAIADVNSLLTCAGRTEDSQQRNTTT